MASKDDEDIAWEDSYHKNRAEQHPHNSEDAQSDDASDEWDNTIDRFLLGDIIESEDGPKSRQRLWINEDCDECILISIPSEKEMRTILKETKNSKITGFIELLSLIIPYGIEIAITTLEKALFILFSSWHYSVLCSNYSNLPKITKLAWKYGPQAAAIPIVPLHDILMLRGEYRVNHYRSRKTVTNLALRTKESKYHPRAIKLLQDRLSNLLKLDNDELIRQSIKIFSIRGVDGFERYSGLIRKYALDLYNDAIFSTAEKEKTIKKLKTAIRCLDMINNKFKLYPPEDKTANKVKKRIQYDYGQINEQLYNLESQDLSIMEKVIERIIYSSTPQGLTSKQLTERSPFDEYSTLWAFLELRNKWIVMHKPTSRRRFVHALKYFKPEWVISFY